MTDIISGFIELTIDSPSIYFVSGSSTFFVSIGAVIVPATFSSSGPQPDNISTSQATTPSMSNVSPPPNILRIDLPQTAVSGTPDVNTITGTYTFYTATSTYASASDAVPFMVQSGVGPIGPLFSVSFDLSVACLHGSSLITTSQGIKRLDSITSQDRVLTGTGEYAPVIALVQCPTATPDLKHTAVIFEPESLGENLPSGRLIIDPGHPLTLPSEFQLHGMTALKPANQYKHELKTKIFARHYDTLPAKTPRYDLILKSPHQTYIAHGMVVKSRTSLHDPGYQHYHAELF